MTKWLSSKDAMPWVGMYVAGASLACTLAMLADAFRGIRERKLWFPNKSFALNTLSMTLIAIAMKLPVDLSTETSNHDDLYAKIAGIFFLITMLANFLPSLGLMDDKELLLNMVAWGILVITITVNVWIQTSTNLLSSVILFLLIFPLVWVFSVALTVPATRRILEHRYKEKHRLTSYSQEINFSYEKLVDSIKKYWMMAETGNPQFALACSEISCAFGVYCIFISLASILFLILLNTKSISLGLDEKSDYKWSINVIIHMQLVGVLVSSIAPILRCLTSISNFELTMKMSENRLNVFRVEKHWFQMLNMWKQSHISSRIPGRHCKRVFHFFRNMLLNFFIALQYIVVVMCKTVCLIPMCFLIIILSCWNLCKSVLRWFIKHIYVSRINVISDMEQYSCYVLQIEDDAKLSKRVLKNSLNSINHVLHASEKKRPENLMKLLKRSTGFSGVVDFDNDRVVLPTNSENSQNSWSLVAVTLTAIAVAFPSIGNNAVNELILSMKEGLQFVRYIEKSLNANEELVEGRKASRRVGIEVEVYRTWLHIDLQNKACKSKTSKDTLQWLGDEAEEKMKRFKEKKTENLDHSYQDFIATRSMYRISRTILLYCNDQDNCPTDAEVFEWILTIIADILYACFTNLPRVITMKCHHDAIEKRQKSIRTAAQILGKSKMILQILKERKLPNLDMYSMAYLEKWHALPKTQIPGSASQNSSDSFIVTIM